MRVISVVLFVATLAAGGCSDGSPCEGLRDLSLASTRDPTLREEWTSVVDSVLAHAPLDSVISVVVFVVPESQQAVHAWGNEHGATMRYEFTGFSAIAFYAPVRSLASLALVAGVTYVDLDNSEGTPSC